MEINIKLNGIRHKNLETLKNSVDSDITTFLQEWYDPKDHVIGHTSGSTGTPKEIRLLKKDMLASARLTNEFFNICPSSNLLLCLSPNYIAGKMMIVRTILSGANLVSVKPSSSPLQNIEEDIDFAAMVPMQVITSLSSPETATKLAHIKQIIIGGAAVSPTLEQQLQQNPTACYGTYGMTETVSHIALRQINGGKRSPYYFALGKVTFEKDERECLIIHAPHLQQQTFVTNDIIQLTDATHFEWLGRHDNVINSGGIKLFPEKIESRIAPLIPQRFFITSEPDSRLGQKAVLVIESASWSATECQKLLSQLRSCLSPTKSPKTFISKNILVKPIPAKLFEK